MKSFCETIQWKLAESGAPALRDVEGAVEHFEQCEECFALLEALEELDSIAERLPILEPPEELVARTLGALRERARVPESANTEQKTGSPESFDAATYAGTPLEDLGGGESKPEAERPIDERSDELLIAKKESETQERRLPDIASAEEECRVEAQSSKTSPASTEQSKARAARGWRWRPRKKDAESAHLKEKSRHAGLLGAWRIGAGSARKGKSAPGTSGSLDVAYLRQRAFQWASRRRVFIPAVLCLVVFIAAGGALFLSAERSSFHGVGLPGEILSGGPLDSDVLSTEAEYKHFRPPPKEEVAPAYTVPRKPAARRLAKSAPQASAPRRPAPRADSFREELPASLAAPRAPEVSRGVRSALEGGASLRTTAGPEAEEVAAVDGLAVPGGVLGGVVGLKEIHPDETGKKDFLAAGRPHGANRKSDVSGFESFGKGASSSKAQRFARANKTVPESEEQLVEKKSRRRDSSKKPEPQLYKETKPTSLVKRKEAKRKKGIERPRVVLDGHLASGDKVGRSLEMDDSAGDENGRLHAMVDDRVGHAADRKRRAKRPPASTLDEDAPGDGLSLPSEPAALPPAGIPQPVLAPPPPPPAPELPDLYGISDTSRVGPDLRQLLLERDRVEDLEYKPATGYWANTYVPGDSRFRQLHSDVRVLARDDASLEAHRRTVERRTKQVEQPFDAPPTGAMGLYLATDRSYTDGPTRTLVQVGLKGTSRAGGRRPPMNIGLLLYVPESVSEADGASIRALVQAFSEARDVGDHFSLTVAGAPGGLLIPPDEFRYGPIRVRLEQLLSGEAPSSLAVEGEPTGRRSSPSSSSGRTPDGSPDRASPDWNETLDLIAAYRRALDLVKQSDDPTRPLGTSEVILITASHPPEGTMAVLETIAHRNAVEGIPSSLIRVGSSLGDNHSESFTLAGQGNLRLIENPDAAEALVDRELYAVSRVVARALRLRIQLAPGVKLIDILGSRRLDEAQAQKVREAEQSIDQRLSRNIGIQADRGEDEAGIQIVIPSYYADDSHVFLLDVVVPGPGPVADVNLKYKDLTFLRNGNARAGISLGHLPQSSGPLEINVLENYVAYRLSSLLEEAAASTDTRSRAVYNHRFEAFEEMLTNLAQVVPGLKSDPGIKNDIALLKSFNKLLRSGNLYVDKLSYLADSLEYAGLLKQLPPPSGEGGGSP